MQWIRSHLSFANAISMIALFVALGGTSVAAVALTKNSVGAKQIKKNAVGASEIKKNAVRAAEVRRNAVGASEIRSNAVAGGDIADNGVGGADLSDNSVGAGEIGPNAVGSGEVTDDSLGATDIDGATLDGEVGPDAFARVEADGSLSTPAAACPGETCPFGPVDQQKGITAAMISHVAGSGRYCFGNLPFVPRSAMVSTDGRDAGGLNPVIAAVTTTRGTNLVNCTSPFSQVRVEMTQIDPTVDPYAAPVAVDKAFYVWFEK
jgi:hypothetical protein